MKTFNHIDDIWEALDTCTTVDQIYDILDSIPQKFGTWWADVVGENRNVGRRGEEFLSY